MFVPICGPFSADTVYCDGDLQAKDVAVTLPEVTAVTYEIQAMGTMTKPDWSRIEHMETAITRIGVDRGLASMSKPGKRELEFRGVQQVTDANGNNKNVGVKAFITGESTKIPGIGVAIGDPSENDLLYATSRYQLFVDGVEMWCIDRYAGICRIDGVDYANYNNLL